ncbi:MAG: hypothetical protein IPN98_18050 [Propionivibrio sp.]|nr:hypothetical protein [Propionivibrio sp.]
MNDTEDEFGPVAATSSLKTGFPRREQGAISPDDFDVARDALEKSDMVILCRNARLLRHCQTRETENHHESNDCVAHK